jgi:prepilin-type N-terminal cleavage/methylation domain-containing protein
MTRSREGFTLIEVMIALTLLSIVLLSFVQATAVVAVRGRTNDLVAKRTAALQGEANKFASLPFASLAGWSTATKTFTKGTFSYKRKLSITSLASNRDSIRITVVPTIDTTKSDYVIVLRSKPTTGSPLCTTCQ